MKQLLLAVLFGLVFSTPTITSQTSGFSQIGKPGQELLGGGYFIAHSSLPLNSKAKVVNLLTGQEVEVTVIRYIPASTNRIADISMNVWQKLELTPDTDIKIYTSASGKPPPRRPRVATPAPAPEAVPPPPPAPPALQTATVEILRDVYDNGYDDGYFDGYYDGYIIDSYQAAQPAPVVETSRQQAPPAIVINDTRAQQAKPVRAPVVETRQEQIPPAVASDIWAQVAKPAELKAPVAAAPSVAVNDTRPQQAQPAPAPVVETRTERTQTFVVNETGPQTAKPSVVIDNSSQQTFQPVMPVIPPVVIENPPQTFQPVMPPEIRTQPAPFTQIKEVVVAPGLPNPNNGKTYFLQVGAYASTDAAAAIARQLVSSGFKVAYDPADSLHRILVRDVPAAMVYDTAQQLSAFGIEEVWLRE
jgi:hypothetical protein